MARERLLSRSQYKSTCCARSSDAEDFETQQYDFSRVMNAACDVLAVSKADFVGMPFSRIWILYTQTRTAYSTGGTGRLRRLTEDIK